MTGTFDSFRDTVKNYFEEKININNDAIENIDEQYNKNNIFIDKINIKINELKKNIDNSYDIFMPNHESKDFNTVEIDKLNDDLNELKEKNIALTETKENINLQNKELNKMLKYITNFEVEKNNIDEEIKNKLLFCEKICVVDSHRCKTELNKINNLLTDVSRETLI